MLTLNTHAIQERLIIIPADQGLGLVTEGSWGLTRSLNPNFMPKRKAEEPQIALPLMSLQVLYLSKEKAFPNLGGS